MEKDYADALLSDIKKSKIDSEKMHLVTIFLAELANDDYKRDEAMVKIGESIELSKDAIVKFTKTAELMTGKIVDFGERLARLELNYDLPEEGRKTATEEGFDFIHKNQEKVLKLLNSNVTSILSLTKDVTKAFESISKSYGHMEDISKRLEKLENK